MHIYSILGGFARLVILFIVEKNLRQFNTLIINTLKYNIAYLYELCNCKQ